MAQHAEHGHGHGSTGVDWDEVYTQDGDAPMWSGRPNGALVAEVVDLPPGRVLDIGCGEGADAIWLANRGWQVTAIDPSGVALERARAAAARWDVDVTWVRAGLLDLPGGSGPHDLVSAQYPALLHRDDDAAMHALLDAVAPGGTLLVVHHVVDGPGAHDHEADPDHDHGPSFDPDDYVMPDDVVAHLLENGDDGWVVEVNEVRSRSGPRSAASHDVDDIVLRARRRNTA